jgi:hypothetical protein
LPIQAGIGDDRSDTIAQRQPRVAHVGGHDGDECLGQGGAKGDNGSADDDLWQAGAPGEVDHAIDHPIRPFG